jgi:hypothetical protein
MVAVSETLDGNPKDVEVVVAGCEVRRAHAEARRIWVARRVHGSGDLKGILDLGSDSKTPCHRRPPSRTVGAVNAPP